MDDTPRSEPAASTPPTGSARKKTGKGMLWAFLAVVIAFFAGFLWQFYEATNVRDQLAQTEVDLDVERLRVRLGQAALAAQAGDFESARQQMSAFFTDVQDQRGELPRQVATVVDDFLAMRDDVITGLSRSSPEYAGVLYGMLEQLGNAVDQAQGREQPVTEMPTGTGQPEGAQPMEPEPAAEGAGEDPDTTQ